MNKRAALSKVTSDIEKCNICKIGKSGKAVPGEGNVDADIMFIGEAPGKTEAKTGRPFVGRSGQLLRSQIREIGLKEKDVFITSPVKYLPDRATPTKSDIEHGKVHLNKQLEIIDPRIIVLLGSVAVQGVLEEKLSIKNDHGKTITKSGRTYFITYHPAAALRFPPIKKLFIEDFKKLKKLLYVQRDEG